MPRQYIPSLPGPSYGTPGGGNDTIARLILAQGQNQADSAARSGAIWGNTIAGVGQQLGQDLQAYQRQKQEKKKQAAFAMQDQAFLARISDTKAGPITPAEALQIYGPERGPAIFKAYASLQSKEPDLKTVLAGFEASTPEMRAQAWPMARQHLVTGGAPDEMIPKEYDEGWYQRFKTAVAGQPKAPGTREVKVRNADGTETTRIVADTPGQEFTSTPPPKEGKKYEVTVPGPGGRPVKKLVTEEELAAGVQQYEAPKSDAAEPLVAIMGPDGNSVLVPRSQATGKRPANAREQGRPVTSGDAGKIAAFDQALDQLNEIGTTLSDNKATGAAAQVGAALPNVVTELTGWGEDAKKKQAVINRVKQIIGKTLEGGVLRKEDEEKYKQILPTIGDDQDVAASKIEGLFATIQQNRQTHLDSLGDAGYDTSKYAARPARERAAQPAGGGVSVLAPDGKTYRFKTQSQADVFKKRAGIR